MPAGKVRDYLLRDLFIFEDENNTAGSKRDAIWPPTVLDQVFDHLSPERKSLRQILEDLKQEILSGGRGNIVFPVTTVNGEEGDVNITPKSLGLGNVDNTRDIDKPLSDLQRKSIMDILKTYDFNIDMSEYIEHMMDTSNPHAVKIGDIDSAGELEKYVLRLIAKHNYSTLDNVHMDIRRSLSNLWIIVDEKDKHIDDRLDRIVAEMRDHFSDTKAHYHIFDTKENISNRLVSFGNTEKVDHGHYPTARAVTEYISDQFREFRKTVPAITEWVTDIIPIGKLSDLPEASEKYHRRVYIATDDNSSTAMYAVCKYNSKKDEFYWDIRDSSMYTKFNPAHFKDSADGLCLNTTSIVEEILRTRGVLDQTLDRILAKYYTKDEIDEMHLIGSLRIIPGTMDGCIRFYVNDDPATMSTDIRVAGLQRLAFMEWITEDQIWDHAIHSRHILNKAIITRHLEDKAVVPSKIALRQGYILANFDDPTGQAHEYTIEEFKRKLGL